MEGAITMKCLTTIIKAVRLEHGFYLSGEQCATLRAALARDIAKGATEPEERVIHTIIVGTESLTTKKRYAEFIKELELLLL